MDRHEESTVDDLVEEVTDFIGSEMDYALEKVLSKQHTDRKMWEAAVYAVQATAEEQVRKLLRTRAGRPRGQ